MVLLSSFIGLLGAFFFIVFVQAGTKKEGEKQTGEIPWYDSIDCVAEASNSGKEFMKLILERNDACYKRRETLHKFFLKWNNELYILDESGNCTLIVNKEIVKLLGKFPKVMRAEGFRRFIDINFSAVTHIISKPVVVIEKN